jgi:predicted dienelactone hydrolase
MLSIFQPTTCVTTSTVPYMPNKTAEYQGPFLQSQFNVSFDLSPLFLTARLPVCTDACSIHDGIPILLFSPGYGIPRLYYSVLASAIASQGFTVITLDHPEDANIVEFTDGHVVYNTQEDMPTDFTPYVYPRVADASFVLDQLRNATAMQHLLPDRGAQAFKTNRIGMLGHSLGGAAAVVAAGQDSRIRAAINFDGSLFGSLPVEGLTQPVLYVSEADATDPTWVDAWPQLKGPKMWIEVANTTHESFTDALALTKAAGLDSVALEGLLGTIEAGELVRVMSTYTAEWMKGALDGDLGEILLGNCEAETFDEVKIIRRDGF